MWNVGARMTMTVTPDGLVVISQNSKGVNPISESVAKSMFGHNVVCVDNSKNAPKPNMDKNYGNHSETRGIHYLERNNIPTEGVKQVSSHYSCDSCRDTQKSTGILNYTGYASDNKNVQKRINY